MKLLHVIVCCTYQHMLCIEVTDKSCVCLSLLVIHQAMFQAYRVKPLDCGIGEGVTEIMYLFTAQRMESQTIKQKHTYIFVV